MYDRILVPTDGSDGIDDVIDHAVALAGEHDAEIHGLYVVSTSTLTDLPMESNWEGLSNALRAEGQNALDDLRALTNEVDVTTEIVEGSPARDIVSYADENDVDVVVMGTHGRSGVDRLLLGSVTERVVRTSNVPVLTVQVSDSSESATNP